MSEQQDDFKTTADLGEIKRMIPHRYPFLLVDKVRDMVKGESAVGIKNVTANEPHFPGHFPQEAVMPGVLQIEALAQTSAVLVSASLGLIDKEALVYFMSVDECRFRRKVVPGDTLELHVTTLRGRGKVWKFKGEAKVDGELATECVFAAMIVPPEGA
ncbi:3-hydroxyacyl-ACP dehydratase FabZ [Roseobacter sp. HKCCA0434]|uniref:3-hydroxyacyl-ACP dehydratase FabZ n=1 Tax=Roseobacter sp. HKCCA0434 TaxID=3079297 RepID=UPI002905A0D3|nr:3-hydroxyacyl-ACP dehydratase FabZ [Roseobacter sp. HKCCA0434]